MSKYKETLRVSPYEIDGKTMFDLRYWKHTPTGLQQTNKAIQFDRKLLTRLIWALQTVHTNLNEQEAKEAAGIEG